MNVYAAASPMADYFKDDFPDLKVIGAGKFPKDADLLILTGGSDINPELYGQRPNGAVGWSNERDEIENTNLRLAISNGKTKVLGVCRGLQLMNAHFGGDLIQDIRPSHPGSHELSHLKESAFSWLTYVNSLHHQAVYNVGSEYGRGHILAVEPVTGVTEMVVWDNRFFGVQFHPEMFPTERGKKFFDTIKKWVSGEISILPKNDGDTRKITWSAWYPVSFETKSKDGN